MSRALSFLAITGVAMLLVAASPVTTSSADDEIVYVTKTGQCYHRDGCRSLRASRIPMSLQEAAARYRPCNICKPPVLASAPKSEARPQGRGEAVKEAPKRAASGGQCKAVTKKGTRCKRKAQPGSDYCWQHQK